MEDSTLVLGLSLFSVSSGDSLCDQSRSFVLNVLDELLHSLLQGEYFVAAGLNFSNSILHLINFLDSRSEAVNSLSAHLKDLLNSCVVILRYIVLSAVIAVRLHSCIVVAQVLLATVLFGTNELLLLLVLKDLHRCFPDVN